MNAIANGIRMIARYTMATAKPRRMCRARKFTGPEAATARKQASTSQPSGSRTR